MGARSMLHAWSHGVLVAAGLAKVPVFGAVQRFTEERGEALEGLAG